MRTVNGGRNGEREGVVVRVWEGRRIAADVFPDEISGCKNV